jgi:hypothetical protein
MYRIITLMNGYAFHWFKIPQLINSTIRTTSSVHRECTYICGETCKWKRQYYFNEYQKNQLKLSLFINNCTETVLKNTKGGKFMDTGEHSITE